MASDLHFYKTVNLEKNNHDWESSHFLNILAGTPKIARIGLFCWLYGAGYMVLVMREARGSFLNTQCDNSLYYGSTVLVLSWL